MSCNLLPPHPKVHPETYFLNIKRQVFTVEISLQPVDVYGGKKTLQLAKAIKVAEPVLGQ